MSPVSRPIYLDNNATTPVDPRVLETMLPYFTEMFGNAASRNHTYGWEAEQAVENAREQIAQGIGATAQEIIFTSGATESNNLALKGVAERYVDKGRHLITSVTEHKCILDTCRYLEQRGYEVTYLPVRKDGLIELDALEAAIRPDTVLVSIMAANNEIGVLQPISAIGKMCTEHEVLFHTDAAQAFGKVPLDVSKMNIHLLSLSGHKFYGPKGIGALYVRRKNPRVQLAPQMHGGGHERGLRSGTLAVPSIVGMGKAAEICFTDMIQENARTEALRNYLWEQVQKRIAETSLNGSLENRLANNLNLSFAFVEGESLLMGVHDTVALSSGSACTSASLEASHVLKALGMSDEQARSSLRFGISRFTTREEIDRVVDKLEVVVSRLRAMSPQWKVDQQKAQQAVY
jgi:cysteine desulfurase